MALVIPTTFTAVDKFSPVIKGMGSNVASFASKAETGVARSERAFRKLTPALSEVQRQLLDVAGTVALVGAAFSAATFTGKAIMDYETELANLQAVTGTSGAAFDVFKGKIQGVATETKKSSVEVAQAFTAIANNQPELLKDAEALAAVTKSSIMLAQASKMELKPAGEALTQILNQFGKSAKDAAATVDILSAGSVAGSSEIRDTAAAIQVFGTAAANAGVKINESVALIELASPFEKGAEAGNKLRNILITMSAIKVQDPKALADMKRLGVNMDIVANSSLPLNTRLNEMAKISKDNTALFHVFGKENLALAAGVLTTADKFSAMEKAVNTAGMTATMAAKNNDTLAISLEQAKAAWVNFFTSSEKAGLGLKIIKGTIRFVTDNLSGLVTTGALILGFFAAWKTALIVSNVLLAIQNFELAESSVVAAAAVGAIWAITAAQWAWNAALVVGAAAMAILTSPITLAVIAVGALVAMFYSFYKHWDMITKAFKTDGIVGGLKAIGATILDAILMPLMAVLKLLTSLPGVGKFAQSAVAGIEKFRVKIGVADTPEEQAIADNKKEAVNPELRRQDAMIQRMESTNNAKVNIDVNDPSGRTKASSNHPSVQIKTTSTHGASGNW